MSVWEATVSLDREAFVSGLAAEEIDTDDAVTFHGVLEVAELGLSVDMIISVPDSFPYGCPKARPLDGSGGLSWHRERSGHLCLYTDDDAALLPWKDPKAFLERIREWFRRDAAGWEGDPIDLDLERYWPRKLGLVVYERDDLTPGAVLRLVREKHHARLLPASRVGKKYAGKALVLDAGQLDQPLHSWSDLSGRIDDDDSVEGQIRSGNIKFLAVRYARDSHEGVLILEVESKDPLEFVALESADASRATLRLRSGPEASAVEGLKIAVVGGGAIGCHVADLLVRMGPKVLTVVDGDTLRPGNLVRHLATADLVGTNKAEAVVETLRRSLVHMAWSPTDLHATPVDLTTINDATALMAEHDLVIDATANGVATALLMAGAEVLERPVVGVCLQRDGQVARVDRAPLLADESHAPAIEPLDPEGEGLRESGCADPVSPAPPWACATAAGLALAVAADVIIGAGNYGATTVQVLVPQPDDAYDLVGLTT